MNTSEWIIIGGGAAGLAAAITLGREGHAVRILEQNDRPGKKLLATGNGRCNITNRTITPARFHSSQPAFVATALDGYGTRQIEAFLRSIGLELVEGKEGQLFPLSRQASSVVEMLVFEAKRLGVFFELNTTVEAVAKGGNTFQVTTNRGTFTSHYLILASGSPAAPQLGGSSIGMTIAEALGHTLVPPHPALVQLESDAPWLRRAAGVKLHARATLLAEGEPPIIREEDVLFTAYGISGLAILDLSREASRMLAHYTYPTVKLDLFPDHTKEQLTNLLLRRIDREADRPFPLWLHAILPKKLIPILLDQSRCTTQSEATLGRKQIAKLVYTLQHLRIPITATHGFKHAEVATGGVDVGEVDPATMESRIVPRLFFAGEILDVDGDRGGFNLHWAWVCGMKRRAVRG
jgi:predicted Rossmann fold flavoprotein